VYLIYDNWDLVVNKINEVYKESILFRTVVESIKFVVKSIYDIFVAFVKTIGVAASTADGLFEALLGKGSAKEVLKKSFNELKDINKEVSKNIGDNFVDGITSAISNKAPAIKTALKKATQNAPVINTGSFSGLGGIAGGSGGGSVTPTSRSKVSVPQLFSVEAASQNFNEIAKAFEESDIFQGIKKQAGSFETRLRESVISKLPALTEAMQQPFNDLAINVSTKMVEVGEAINNALTGIAVEGFAAFGDFIANLVTGDTGALQGFFKNILLIISDFGVTLGKQLIALGLASEGLKKLFTNPFTAIAAGIGLIAISKIAKNIVSKGVPKLAIGTDYVNQDGLAYLHKGEKVVPAKVAGGGYSGGGQVEVVGTLRGMDLYLTNKYSGNTYNRLR
jgi:hypothetical protein